MLFRSVIGHTDIKNKLIRSVNNGRISHAQLFLGPEGSGNLAMALAYIQYLFCENRGENDACGTCTNCIKVAKMEHPDVHFSFPFFAKNTKDTASNYVKPFRKAILQDPYLNTVKWFASLEKENKQGIINVSEIADFTRKLTLKSYEGGFKVGLIWMPENMNDTAAHKILKTLEEPPPQTVIILVANDQEGLFKTIVSRTQIVVIPRLGNEEIKNGLIDMLEMEPDLAENLAAVSDGNFFLAKEQAQNIGKSNENFELFRDWMRLCFKKDLYNISKWTQKIGGIGREKQKHFLNYALFLIRQCAVLNYGAENLVTMGGDERVFMQRFAPFVTHENLQEYIDEFELAYRHIQQNANARILFTDLSYRILVLLNKAKK